MRPIDVRTMSLFDEFVDSYEASCAEGLKLSGESRDYFAEQRIQHTLRLCSSLLSVSTVVDFGCGLGHATPHLRNAFPGARIVGIDSSHAAVAFARSRYSKANAEFMSGDQEGLQPGSVDVVYSNGTFHHIEPDDRPKEIGRLFHWMSPGGLFALWENNPWNPGTRLVMKRIPFDRDAQLLSYVTAGKLLNAAGFRVGAVSSHFYFPAWLRSLRPLEPYLERVPLGAQYCVIAEKPR
jgi:SAM-dependent methyltransferase